MSLMDKYKENNIIAEKLFLEEYYDGAVNRYYYSIFQLIMRISQEKGIELEDEEKCQKGSHEKAINNIETYLRKKGPKNITKCHKFKSKCTDLKKYRNKADYKDDLTIKKDAEIVKNTYNELKQLMNNI